jgi:cytochrome oxidase assembly protein ShyY1
MLLAASAVIALVLLAGLSVSLWQMQRAMQAETEANTNEQKANQNAQKSGAISQGYGKSAQHG